MSNILHWGDQKIDFEKKLRLTQAPRGEHLPPTVVEGVLCEAPTSESNMHEPFKVHLVFFSDVKADWVPGYGDTLENVE